MVSGDDSAKKGTQLCFIEESYINKQFEKQYWDLDMISLFLLNMFMLAGLRAKFTAPAESISAMD